jgi:hypothetical protein
VEYTEIEATSFLNYIIANYYIKPISGSFGTYSPLKQHFHWHKFSLESANEPTHLKSRRELERLDYELSRKIRTIESIRIKFHSAMQDFMSNVEDFLIEYTKNMKSTLQACMQLEALPQRAIQDLGKSISSFVDSINIEKELNKISDVEITGFKPLSTNVHKSFTGVYSCVIYFLIFRCLEFH